MPRKPSGVWVKYTTVIGPSIAGSGGFKWKCKFCEEEFNSTITRVLRHVSGVGGKGIGGCKSVPKNIVDEENLQNPNCFSDSSLSGPAMEDIFEDLEEVSESVGGGATDTSNAASMSRSKRSRMNSNMGSTPPSFDNPSSSCRNARRPTQSTLPRALGSLSWLKERQRIANLEIGRTVIECNLSFNVLQTTQWRRMIKVVSSVGACEAWEGVCYKEMRTTVLDEEMGRIQKAFDPIKEGWKKFGCSILSDGWSDIRRRSIISILVSSCLGTYFLKAVDVGKGGQRITGEFIFHHIRQTIVEIGPENVVQVVTDNASNCRRMGDLIEQEFPSIVWTPCASHCLDLLMEDIGKLPWISSVILEASAIVSFFSKKTKALAIFREYSHLEILRPLKTWFAYMFIVLDRLLAIHNDLRRTVVSSERVERSDSTLSESIRVQGAYLDPTFWMDVQAIVMTSKPLFIVLCVINMEGSTLGLLHHFMGKIFTELDGCSSLSAERLGQLKGLVEKRWNWMRRPIHGIATLLHPLWKSNDLFMDVALLEARDAYLSRIYSEEEQMKIGSKISMYQNNVGVFFSRSTSRRRELCVKPIEWWETYDYSTPHIWACALRILSQLQSLEEGAESLRERCQKFYKCCRKYTEGLGEAYDGDIAFASAVEGFGGSHDDPISMAVGGPVMTKFTIALREIGTYKEVLRSQVEHMLNDRLIQFANIDLQEAKEVRKRFEKASNQYDQVREKFLSLKKGTKTDIISEIEEDLRNARSSFEQARFNLVTTLSNIEAKKKFEFLEAVSGTMDAHLRYFKQGYELFLQMEPYIHQVLTYAQQSRERANYEQAGLADKMQEYRRQMELEYDRPFSETETLTSGDGIQIVGRSTYKVIEAVMQSTPRGKVQTIKQGYLLKRSSNRRGDWKRRYFVLDSRGILYYYRKQWGKSLGGSQSQHNGPTRAHSSEHNSGLLGRFLSHHHHQSPQEEKATLHHTVNLLTATIKVDAEQSELRFCFRIVSPSKIYTLQAENAMEQMDWIDKITGVIASLLNAQVSDQAGYSHRLRSPVGSSHQRTASESSTLSSTSEFDHSVPDESPSTRSHSGARKDRSTRSPLSNMPEHMERPLDLLRKVPGNDVCADCNAPDPDWASLNLGILLCIECSGVHRNLGVHISKVRSLTLDVKVWETSVIKLFQSIGNSYANSVWEENLLKWGDERHVRGTLEGSDSDEEEIDAYLPPLKPYPRDSLATKEKYINAKYAEKQFIMRHKGDPQEALAAAWQIWDAVQENKKQLVYRLMVTYDVDANITYEQVVSGPWGSAMHALNTDPEIPPDLNLDLEISGQDASSLMGIEGRGKDVADGSVSSLKGCTLLHLACVIGDLGMVELLLQYGAKVNATDYRGRSPLHHCIENGRNACAKLLLSRTANPSAVDKDGKTALQMAMEIGSLTDEELFLMLSETSA